MKSLFVIFIYILLSATLTAQVSNDNIEDRLKLKIGQVAHSKTDDCTVQFNCIDQSVTGSCLIYHNDQWFEFNSGSHSKLFLNVSDQQCRDLKGVQVVVVKGTPCDKKSYELITCASFGNQDDVFLTLNNLDKNTDYLVLIDGYLNDFCRFNIQVGEVAKGIPVNQYLRLPFKAANNDGVISFDWLLPDSIRSDVEKFEIYQRKGSRFKSDLIKTINVKDYAYGNSEGNYSFIDTISLDTSYEYKVVARHLNGAADIVSEYLITPDEELLPREVSVNIVPSIKIRKKDEVTVVVRDFYSRRVIKSFQFTGKEIPDEGFYINKAQYSKLGLKRLRIEIINNDSGRKEEIHLDIN
ncbi:hypothetical protein OO013_02580 [Mangrovivirga sp. M17]|uniref:Fibronectin type-III domain-containing protein n=1 Tax=Mangrovivirga halotolerans TaxID=2993936 RepID=A0ABT3RN90_9BACT|nr:hypothetical protein [Mangrovivirga halotolerans]MCX2742732.1 hypothetical protein [Mangrovivirga halotolerans]